jgi:uncharacterized protein
MSTKIFVNLAVKDLSKTVPFFDKLGFKFNPQFTDEKATCMIVSEDIYVMFLVEKFFKTFIPKEISDTSRSNEAIITLSAESRAKVNELVDKALLAGGKTSHGVQDEGGMYGRAFEDLDGHLWEVMYMDMNAVEH